MSETHDSDRTAEPEEGLQESVADDGAQDGVEETSEAASERDFAEDSASPKRRSGQDVELASLLRHKRGCPQEGYGLSDEGSRIESYTQSQPDGNVLLVVRCIECGEAEVANNESED